MELLDFATTALAKGYALKADLSAYRAARRPIVERREVLVGNCYRCEVPTMPLISVRLEGRVRRRDFSRHLTAIDLLGLTHLPEISVLTEPKDDPIHWRAVAFVCSGCADLVEAQMVAFQAMTAEVVD